MSSKFLVMPAGSFTGTYETVSLVPDVLPSSLTHDFDATDASSLTYDGSNKVSQWDNQVSATPLASSGDFRPLYVADQLDFGAVKFEASPQANYIGADALTHTLSTGYSVAIVVSQPTAATGVLWASDLASNVHPCMFVQSGTARVRHTTDSTLPTTLPLAQLNIIVVSYDPNTGTVAYYMNGAAVSGSPASIVAPGAYNGIWFGKMGSVTSTNIFLHRFLMFNATLSSGDIAKVNRILNNQFSAY